MEKLFDPINTTTPISDVKCLNCYAATSPHSTGKECIAATH